MDVFGQVRIADVADILIVAVLVYATINLIRGTRAVQMLVGLAVLAGMYVLAQSFELYTLSWILRAFLGSFFLLIVVLFQDDIRRVLTRVGRARLFGGDRGARTQVIDEVTRASTELAGRKIGALIVIERDTSLKDFVEMGTLLDAKVSKKVQVKARLHSRFNQNQWTNWAGFGGNTNTSCVGGDCGEFDPRSNLYVKLRGVNVTVTPGRARPSGSVTCPEIWPVPFACAKAPAARPRRATPRIAMRRRVETRGRERGATGISL